MDTRVQSGLRPIDIAISYSLAVTVRMDTRVQSGLRLENYPPLFSKVWSEWIPAFRAD